MWTMYEPVDNDASRNGDSSYSDFDAVNLENDGHGFPQRKKKIFARLGTKQR